MLIQPVSRFVGAFVLLLGLALLEPASAQTIKMVALGDSLTAGLGLPVSEAFPARLEAALKARGHDVAIVNAGVSGDTASDGLARLDWSVGDDANAVIVELGANDMLRGVAPATTRAALDKILQRLADRNLPVILTGMVALPNLGAAYTKDFDAIYPDLARKYDVVLYPFFLDGLVARGDVWQADHMHPNVTGVDVIVERIAPVVEQLLKRLEKSS